MSKEEYLQSLQKLVGKVGTPIVDDIIKYQVDRVTGKDDKQAREVVSNLSMRLGIIIDTNKEVILSILQHSRQVLSKLKMKQVSEESVSGLDKKYIQDINKIDDVPVLDSRYLNAVLELIESLGESDLALRLQSVAVGAFMNAREVYDKEIASLMQYYVNHEAENLPNLVKELFSTAVSLTDSKKSKLMLTVAYLLAKAAMEKNKSWNKAEANSIVTNISMFLGDDVPDVVTPPEVEAEEDDNINNLFKPGVYTHGEGYGALELVSDGSGFVYDTKRNKAYKVLDIMAKFESLNELLHALHNKKSGLRSINLMPVLTGETERVPDLFEKFTGLPESNASQITKRGSVSKSLLFMDKKLMLIECRGDKIYAGLFDSSQIAYQAHLGYVELKSQVGHGKMYELEYVGETYVTYYDIYKAITDRKYSIVMEVMEDGVDIVDAYIEMCEEFKSISKHIKDSMLVIDKNKIKLHNIDEVRSYVDDKLSGLSFRVRYHTTTSMNTM